MTQLPEDADAESRDPEGKDKRASRSTDWSAWTETLRDITPYLDLGWRVVGAAAGPPIIGYAVDAGLETSPWGLLIGCGLGLAGAALQLIRLGDEFTRSAP